MHQENSSPVDFFLCFLTCLWLLQYCEVLTHANTKQVIDQKRTTTETKQDERKPKKKTEERCSAYAAAEPRCLTRR